ncbi:MAG: hypothetical protein AAFQ19_16365, partial [Pseudomonadota bacterium]
TPKGSGLVPVMLAMMHWGDKHCKDGPPALALTDRRTGNPLRVGLVQEGAGVPMRRLTYAVTRDAPPDDT